MNYKREAGRGKKEGTRWIWVEPAQICFTRVEQRGVVKRMDEGERVVGGYINKIVRKKCDSEL